MGDGIPGGVVYFHPTLQGVNIVPRRNYQKSSTAIISIIIISMIRMGIMKKYAEGFLYKRLSK